MGSAGIRKRRNISRIFYVVFLLRRELCSAKGNKHRSFQPPLLSESACGISPHPMRIFRHDGGSQGWESYILSVTDIAQLPVSDIPVSAVVDACHPGLHARVSIFLVHRAILLGNGTAAKPLVEVHRDVLFIKIFCHIITAELVGHME